MPAPSHLMILVVGASLAAGGCGPNCQDTCNRLYQQSECNIRRPGRTQDELMQTCMDECELALSVPGELGDYNPYETRGTSDAIAIDNDRQAAVWMDCVATTSCDLLETNWCPPVW